MRSIIVEFDSHVLAADLWDDRAPKTCARIWDALPQEGQVTNVIWGGEMLRVWIQVPEPDKAENVQTLHNPGDILFVPGWNGLRLVYGQAQMRGPAGPYPVPAVGRIRGGLPELSAFAKRVEWEGHQTMRVRRG